MIVLINDLFHFFKIQFHPKIYARKSIFIRLVIIINQVKFQEKIANHQFIFNNNNNNDNSFSTCWCIALIGSKECYAMKAKEQ